MKITKEQIIEIEKETNNGKTAKEIANLLGITVGMVEYQRKKNGWSSKHNPNILMKHLDEIKELVENEVSDSDIAKIYNCNTVTVYNFRIKNNLSRRNLKYCQEKEISSEVIEFLLGSDNASSISSWRIWKSPLSEVLVVNVELTTLRK